MFNCFSLFQQFFILGQPLAAFPVRALLRHSTTTRKPLPLARPALPYFPRDNVHNCHVCNVHSERNVHKLFLGSLSRVESYIEITTGEGCSAGASLLGPGTVSEHQLFSTT